MQNDIQDVTQQDQDFHNNIMELWSITARSTDIHPIGTSELNKGQPKDGNSSHGDGLELQHVFSRTRTDKGSVLKSFQGYLLFLLSCVFL
jgi:hypothetical protein